jgi:hypothetical protein
MYYFLCVAVIKIFALLILVIRIPVVLMKKFLVMMVMSVPLMIVYPKKDVLIPTLIVMTIMSVLKTGVTVNKDVFIVR